MSIFCWFCMWVLCFCMLSSDGMCVFISSCAVLSPRWESSCLPLWVAFDLISSSHLSWSSGPWQPLQTQSNPPPATQWTQKLPDPSYIPLNNNKYEFFFRDQTRPSGNDWNSDSLHFPFSFALKWFSANQKHVV